MPNAQVSNAFDDALSTYVERGIFRNLKSSTEDGVHVYRFGWLSEFHPVTLVHDPTERSLAFVRLFPKVPADVLSYLQQKVAERSDPDSSVPEHRRIDPALATTSVPQDDEDASLQMSLAARADDAQALRALVRLANDLVFDLQLRFPTYTYRHFAQSDE